MSQAVIRHFGIGSVLSGLHDYLEGAIIGLMSTRAVDIDKLNVEEKLRLIEELWESLSNDPSRIPLTQAQKSELDRRLDVIEEGDDAGIPWNDVLDRIRNRLT
jgi:putative addiction module component (TIGR02574 family)